MAIAWKEESCTCCGVDTYFDDEKYVGDLGSKNPSTRQKCYVVFEGRIPGIYHSWVKYQDSLKGRLNAHGQEYPDFTTAVDAFEQYSKTLKVGAFTRFKAEEGEVERLGLAGPFTDKMEAFMSSHLVIHTDGCCLHNDEEGIRAGYGLYYGPKDSRNNGFRLSSSEPQTNHRVELAAVLQALVDNPALPLTICTDSQYAINCVKVWWEKWEANGYRNTKGKRVENDDLVRRIVEETNKRRRKSLATDFILVPARSGVTGNQRAKLLACDGAIKRRVE